MIETFSLGLQDQMEKQRQSLVRLIFLLFILLIFEGALRKWVAPGLSNPLLFIRDPFLLMVYVKAMQQNRMAMRSLLDFGLLIGMALIALAMLQVMLGDIPFVVAGYGLRNYILYLPLPFVMYANMAPPDTIRLIRLLLTLSIPLGALGVVQSYLPADHFLNVGLGGGEIFTAGNQVRTYGTFTFTAGHGNYLTLMMPIAAGALLFFPSGSRERRLATLSILSLSCASVTSGSRGVIVGLTITFALFILIIAVMGGGRNIIRAVTATVAVLVLAAASYFAFSYQFENIASRFQSGDEAEGSIVDRALAPLTKLGDALSDGALLGVGVGKGTGGGSYLGTGSQEFVLAEEETFRIIQECGALLGLLYVIYRFLLLFTAIRVAVFTLKASGNPIPALMIAFMAPSLLVGQITLNNTSNGFNWLGLGLLFCASQLPAQQHGSS